MPGSTGKNRIPIVTRLLVFLILLMGVLAIGSHWRVANPEHFYYELNTLNLFHNLHQIWPWIPDLFNVVLKQRVNATDAIVNLLSLSLLLLTIVFYIVAFLLSGFVSLLRGSLSFSLEQVLLGFAVIATSPFLLVLPVIVWFVGFLHPMTVSYFLIWAFMGPLCLISGYWVNKVLLKWCVSIFLLTIDMDT